MKKISILMFLISLGLSAQEYKIYEFGDPIPTVKITENDIYSYNSFGVKSDTPSIRFRAVDSNRIEIFTVDSYGVENFEPITIKRSRPINRQMSSEEILNRFKQRQTDERVYIDRRRD